MLSALEFEIVFSLYHMVILLGPGTNINGSKHNINGSPRTEGPEALGQLPNLLEFGREKVSFWY